MDRIRSEPVITGNTAQAIVYLASLFGLHFSAGQMAALFLVTQVILIFWNRKRVTPTNSTPAVPVVPPGHL